MNTIFPRLVSLETILFWKLECGKYSLFDLEIHNLKVLGRDMQH